MNLSTLWQSLDEDARRAEAGYVLRRLATDTEHFDLRLAVIAPERTRALMIRFAKDAQDPMEIPDSTGFSLSTVTLPGDLSGTTTLELRLRSRIYADVFDALVRDLVESSSDATTEADAVVRIVDRLKRWQMFIARTAPDGLSRSEQIGLFGELCVLRALVVPALGILAAAEAWTGPAAKTQDFQHGGVAIEVKGSAAQQPQYVRISSERQLDDLGVAKLYLAHVSLDERRGSGETLPELVESVRALCETARAATLIETRLFDVGYLDEHAHRYQETGYELRRLGTFLVAAGFPRIVEDDLVAGVGDVHFSISLAACEPFSVTAEAVQFALTKHSP